MESNLAENFYYYINLVPMRKWSEYIRILGLPETDIDETYYENNDPNEQKYQMLSRWKSYYGYNKDVSDVVDCLKLAYEELNGNHRPELLNRKLTGYLSENRQVARLLYGIIRNLHKEERKRFAMVKLKISDIEIDAISRNFSRDIEEREYQMFHVWTRRNMGLSHVDMRDILERYTLDFRTQSSRTEQTQGPRAIPGAPVERHPEDTVQSSSRLAAPSGDIQDS